MYIVLLATMAAKRMKEAAASSSLQHFVSVTFKKLHRRRAAEAYSSRLHEVFEEEAEN